MPLQGRHAAAGAPVGIVAAYLSALADSGRKSSTIGRRAAAIGYRHKIAGHEPPTSQEGVKAVLRGIRRTIGSAKQGKAPATADLMMQMVAMCPDNMIGKRDRALLCLGFAGAFRRSELCALDVDDLAEVPDGLRILIRRSKGDQEGQGQEVAIPRGYKLRPVEAVQTWLAAAEISAGPVFRAVALGGRVSDVALADDSAARIIKRYARRVGLDPAAYSGHSLRSGLPDVGRRERGEDLQDDGDQPAPLAGHAARLRPEGGPVQGARGGGVPVMALGRAKRRPSWAQITLSGESPALAGKARFWWRKAPPIIAGHRPTRSIGFAKSSAPPVRKRMRWMASTEPCGSSAVRT